MGRFISSYEICECCVIAASHSVYQIAQRQPHFPPFVPNSFALCSGAMTHPTVLRPFSVDSTAAASRTSVVDI